MAYSKKRTKELFDEAKSLGLIVRSNMKGEVIEERINRLKGGESLESINPTPRGGKKTAAKAAPASTAPAAKAAKSKPQVYNLYAVDGSELAFAVMSEGTDPQSALVAATEKGDIAPETPVIAIPLSYVERPVSVKRIEQPPVYEAVTITPAKAEPKKEAAPAAAPKAPAATSARKSGGTSARKAPTAPAPPAPPVPPAPGVADDNPFV